MSEPIRGRSRRNSIFFHYDESFETVGRSDWDFSDQLQQFGPDGQRLTASRSQNEAEAYCQFVARTHYENFSVASFLIPRLLRQDFHNIYAYCRWSDDCADEAGSTERATSLLAWWQSELDALFDGGLTPHPVMQALRTTIAKHGLPKQPFADLLSAFRQDQTQLRYDSMSQLVDYCARSANPVGRLVLGLAGAANDAESVRLSDAICTGLQLANFCQDIRRDSQLNRIYVPRELWQRHGVDEPLITAGRVDKRLQAMLAEFVEIAHSYFNTGRDLHGRVPRWLARDIELFRGGGLAILAEIRRLKYDVWTRRPTVSKLGKLKLLWRVISRRR